MKFLLGIICFLLSFHLAFSQHLSKNDAIADLTFLRDNIEKYNPALKIYKPDFHVASTRIIDAIYQDEISLNAYFTYISQICALSDEGHFALGNWSDTVHNGIPQNKFKYLPIAIKVIDNDLYVWRDYSLKPIMNQGDKIISINGLNAEDILNRLRLATPSDGEIITYADQIINLSFPWIYYFYIDQKDHFQIKYQSSPKEPILETKIKALTREEQVSSYKALNLPSKPQEESIKDFYELHFKKGHALLKLKSFDIQLIKKYGIHSRDFYQEIFTSLENHHINSLIIDLRDNTGGRNEFADDMVPYIMKGTTNDPFLKKSISWSGKERVYKIPKKSSHAFTGIIYVLVNGRTFSAGSTLARYLKEYGDAIVIGTETGTRYEGFAAGSKEYISLPHSSINIGIPRFHLLFPVSQKQTTSNRGLLPDYPIKASIQDLIDEKDLDYEQALELISQE
ncbi:hypothetical protein IFO69_17955 [Echinicola sp. CAU 1574]|uniref:Tail specific protease domain-containing protein n=1 Tax=Echinicola arenosa TaxID=2774144 RepID=A0ABR9APC5_9BACT|nr:S41 family peptidase [Echinicola arenosa]MBD8490643.1 hypothetical protein [Echinicola arenosa]